MKKQLPIVLFVVSILCAPFVTLSAQQVLPQFGYLSYSAVLLQMPEYTMASQQYEELRGKYEAEATRAEEEFQRKFAEFMQGQRDFPASIMQKRQAELQELMERSISFRQESQRLLAEAESALKQPAVDHLNAAIKAVGAEQGLMFILNIDGNACPFVHPQAGVDVTTAVLERLQGSPIALP
ncbi:MAG: OmpH family outer membrane protein [Bacteroidaceae bacterium]|nr:OmpH family outer membrane protein [Bacteroidaceae bacterium]